MLLITAQPVEQYLDINRDINSFDAMVIRRQLCHKG